MDTRITNAYVKTFSQWNIVPLWTSWLIQVKNWSDRSCKYFFLVLFVCVCVSVLCVLVCVSACVQVSMCTWMTQDSLGWHSLGSILFFCCYDKTPWQRQVIERGLVWSCGSRGIRVLWYWDGEARHPDRHGSRTEKAHLPTTRRKQREWMVLSFWNPSWPQWHTACSKTMPTKPTQ